MYVTMHPPSPVGLSCYDHKNMSLLRKAAAAVLTRHFNPVLVEIPPPAPPPPPPPKKEEEKKEEEKRRTKQPTKEKQNNQPLTKLRPPHKSIYISIYIQQLK